MTNLERIKLEIEDINIEDAKLEVYLLDNDLSATEEYTRNDNLNILKTVLAVLESIANNTSTMKNYKSSDIDVSNFGENLQNRIEQLIRKIRASEYQQQNQGATFTNMFAK